MVAPERRVPASAANPSPSCGAARAPAILTIGGRIVASDAPGLCEGARRVLDGRLGQPLVCDVGASPPRTQARWTQRPESRLAPVELGSQIMLRAASPELRGLLDLMGLAAVVPCERNSVVEPRRQPEEREQLRGVEEERDPGDLVA